MNKKRKALKLMQYYFRLIAKEAGVNWDRDNDAEIEAMLDYIIDAAVGEALNCVPSEVIE